MATSDYVFATFFDTEENAYTDASGAITILGPAAAGTVMNFSSPTTVIGEPVDNMTRQYFYLSEWSNLVLAGREFVTSHPRRINPTVVFVYATEAAAVVNVASNGVFYTAVAVAAGAVEVITGNIANAELEFSSTADVLISSTSDGANYITIPPAAQTIFGQCSSTCVLSVLGADKNVNITRSCTNGTVEEVHPGAFTDQLHWQGETCSWSAPEGYKISGRTSSDGTGWEGVAFIAAEHFHRITPIPAQLKSLLLISDSPAVCTRSDGGSVSLTGAVGVFHALLTGISRGVVFECDLPVTAIADGRPPPEFSHTDYNYKEMNLVIRSYSTTTTTTATTTTATTTTASNTTTTSTTATHTSVTSTTTPTSTTSATTTSTTATSTSATSTATTVTTSTATSTATTSTATTATGTSATSTATTVTTTTATGTTVTFTGATTTSTATTATTTTATDTSVSTTITATNVTTTATATSVSSTATNVTTTATATTVSLTFSNVTTTATATSSRTTATNVTTTATATISATTATLLTTRTTATTSTSTSSSSASTTQTATTPTSTSSSTTATATTATSTTSSITTSTATTETATTSTKTLTTATSTSSTSSSDTSTTATGTPTTQTMTNSTATPTTTTHSATSTTTLTALVTATTTTATVTTLPIASVVVQKVESMEGSVLSAALDSNDTTSGTVQMGNFTLVAAVIDADAVAAAGGSLTVVVEGTNASVTVPASMLDSVVEPDGTVLVVTALDSATSDALSITAGEASTEVKPILEVKAALNVNLFNLKGTRLTVDGLLEPIKVVMPVNYTSGIQCVWWDEAASDWSTDGVQLAGSEGGLVVCETFHLTLFAAILEGFTQTFLCSQVTLLNKESVKELRGGGWWLTTGAIMVWSVILLFMILLSIAHCLDRRRIRQGTYDAEHLLIPKVSLIETRNPLRNRSTKSELAVAYCASCAACSCWIMRWAKSSAALRDALDDVVSNWVSHFSEIRDFIEGLFGGLECCSARGKGGVGVVVHRLMTKTLTMSARRQAAAELGISHDVSCALLEHEDIKQVLLAHHSRGPMVTVPREETWGTMHSRIEDRLDSYMETSASWSALPGTVWRLFRWQTPFGACLVHCNFRSSKLRVLFFMVEIIGSLMLGTVFFQASGVPGKRNRSVDCSFDEAYKLIGRILAIGTGSVVISGVPVIILNSLCTKKLKKFEYEGCPEWNRQLRIWRTQTVAVWVLGLSYVGFCIFFVALFLANVRVEDHASWLLSGLISVLEDTILIPLSVAVSIPLLSALCLNLVSRWRKVKKGDLVYERRMEMRHEGNMTLALQQI